MKIIAVQTYALEQKLPAEEQFAFSQHRVTKRNSLICRIDTDTGLTGWGEAFGPSRIHKTIIDHYYAPSILGKTPWDSGVIWETLYNLLRDNGQKGVTIQALSAVDIALWDLKAKDAGLPLYQLLGGAFRDKLKPYATGMYRKYTKNEIEETVSEAESYVEQGFTALKIKTGFGMDYDRHLVQSIRRALPEIELMIDANHAYNAMEAIRVGKSLEEFDIRWYEEPVPPEDLDGYKEVKAKVGIPISGGEAEFTRYGMKKLLDERCVDILQPDCTITGGLSEVQKIAALCSIANIQCIPHVWGSGVALATGIHATFSLPDFPPALEPALMYLEYDRTSNVFREKLASGIPQLQDGMLPQPVGAGLGIEIDEDMLDFYSVK